MMSETREQVGAPVESIDKQTEMSCEAFQAQIPELISGNIHDHPHLKNWHGCNALIQELEDIAEAARSLFAAQEPSANLWDRIKFSLPEGDAEPAPGGHSSEPIRGV